MEIDFGEKEEESGYQKWKHEKGKNTKMKLEEGMENG